jgi:hypothetical protein
MKESTLAALGVRQKRGLQNEKPVTALTSFGTQVVNHSHPRRCLRSNLCLVFSLAFFSANKLSAVTLHVSVRCSSLTWHLASV